MSLDNSLNKILIVDFGSQFTQLIARRIRELGVFSDIVSHKKIKLNQINQSIKGIILSVFSLSFIPFALCFFSEDIGDVLLAKPIL